MSIVQTSSELAITKLPLGWDLVRLKSIADIRYGLGQPPPERDGGVPMIRATDIDAGRIIEGNFLCIDPDSLPVERDPYLKEGEIIVVRSGAYTGDSAIVPAKYAGAVAGYDMVVTVKRAVPEFVGFCLLSGYVVEGQLLLLTLRAAQPHLNAQELGVLQVPLPPLPEQQRIAAYLDASCAAIDAAVAAKRRQLETLDALRKTIIHRAVTQGLNDSIELRDTGSDVLRKIPEGWKLIRLKRIADIRYGLGQPPPELEGGVPMIRATNIDSGRIVDENLLRIDVADLPVARDPFLNEDEIIVVRSGAYTGDSAIVPRQYAGAVAGYDMVVTVRRADPRFVSYSLLSGYVLNGQILLLTLRAAQPHLNAEELGGIVLALPESRSEQHSICAYLDKKLGELGSIVSGIEAQITALTAYRKSLIHECVTGQRRVTEADVRRVEVQKAAATSWTPRHEETSANEAGQ